MATGGRPLKGSIRVHGAKNAVLPLLAASILTDETVAVEDCPFISDVDAMTCLLSRMGAQVRREGRRIYVRAEDVVPAEDMGELCGAMRSSMFLVGALLARRGEVRVPLPGGCKIGDRPLDIHLDGMAKLGAEASVSAGEVRCRCARLKGADIVMRYPSVGATENLLLCAAVAEGRTRLINCAREPEIIALARALNAMGGRVRGEGSSVMTVDGVDKLHGATLVPNPDRIVAGTLILAAALLGGDVTVLGADKRDADSLLPYLPCMRISADGAGVRVVCDGGRMRAFEACTAPYPLLATDMQPQLFACALKARGVSRITETVFRNRFAHARQFEKLGAKIYLTGSTATIVGVDALRGAALKADDLRGGAGLCLAALAAEGESRIEGVEYIDRGYEGLEETLSLLGADIRRVRVDEK